MQVTAIGITINDVGANKILGKAAFSAFLTLWEILRGMRKAAHELINIKFIKFPCANIIASL